MSAELVIELGKLLRMERPVPFAMEIPS